MKPVITPLFLNPDLVWRPLTLVHSPTLVCAWLADQGSLTQRLQQLGRFRVAPQQQLIAAPRPEEARLLGQAPRRSALIREVLLYVDDAPVVFARSILPLPSLRGANRILGHMAKRSLGAELFKAPRAQRDQVWAARVCLPESLTNRPCWGRQSLFLKRGKPLLVSEVFLPSLWQRLGESID